MPSETIPQEAMSSNGTMTMSPNVANGEAYTVTQVITPEEAEQMLAANYPKQRKLKLQKVIGLAHDMETGEFVGQASKTIHVSSDGWLIDGQHRLNAIIRCGKPQTIDVKYGGGTADELFNYLDGGDVRKPENFLDCKNPNGVKAVGKAVICLERGATLTSAIAGFVRQYRINGKKVIEAPTRADIVNFSIENTKKLEDVVTLASPVYKSTRCNRTMISLAMYLLREICGGEVVEAYIADLALEAPTMPITMTIQKYLLHRCMDAKAQHTSVDKRLVFSALLYGFELFSKGKTVKSVNKRNLDNAFNRFDRMVQEHYGSSATQSPTAEQ